MAVERQRREQEAERTRADLSEVQRIAHVGSWILEVGTGRLVWSDEVFRILGVTRAEFPRDVRGIPGAGPPGRRDRGSTRHTTMVAVGGAAWRSRTGWCRPGGEVRTIIRPWRGGEGPGGRPLRIMGTVLDITRRRLSEDALREQSGRIADGTPPSGGG